MTGGPIVVVYRNPLDQAVLYFQRGESHKDATHNSINGRLAAAVSLRDA